jgi:hypothetical protein
MMTPVCSYVLVWKASLTAVGITWISIRQLLFIKTRYQLNITYQLRIKITKTERDIDEQTITTVLE